MKCLVTKLNGVVSNSEILRLGETRIYFDKVDSPSGATQGFTFGFNKPVVLKIIGDGYFTDKTLTENRGMTLTLNGDYQSVCVSNNTSAIAVLDKYSITRISTYYPEISGTGTNKRVNLWDFKMVKNLTYINLDKVQVNDSIEELRNLTGITYLSCNNTLVCGNIANLKNLVGLRTLSLGNTQVNGNIGDLSSLTSLDSLYIPNSQVGGNIGDLKSLTNLTSLNLTNTLVSGNIGDLKSLTKLIYLNASNRTTPLTGNIGELSSLTKVTDMVLEFGNFTGDLATVPASCRYISFNSDVSSTFTWGSRQSSAKIIAIEGGVKIANIDKMLQDQAQCVVGFSSGDASRYKTISVTGTRTSASDAAVQALQSKGYTVSITPA